MWIILKILVLDPMHGWAISQQLRKDALQVSDGSLGESVAGGCDRPAITPDERG